MSRKHLLAAATAADLDRELKQQRLQASWLPWRRRLHRHHAAVVVGGSFVTGILLARSPGRLLLRAASAMASIASLMLRTPLGNLMVASVSTVRSSAADVVPKSD